MNIIVCIKRVPDTAEVPIEISEDQKGIKNERLTFDLNEPDKYALEEAVLLKEQLDGTVTCITVGNEECDSKCLKACPYDSPQFGPEKGAKMRKCTFCLDRHLENKIPVCVQTCRPRALYAGNLDELKAKYGEKQEADNFTFSERTKPAIIFNPKKN